MRLPLLQTRDISMCADAAVTNGGFRSNIHHHTPITRRKNKKYSTLNQLAGKPSFPKLNSRQNIRIHLQQSADISRTVQFLWRALRWRGGLTRGVLRTQLIWGQTLTFTKGPQFFHTAIIKVKTNLGLPSFAPPSPSLPLPASAPPACRRGENCSDSRIPFTPC